MEKMEHLFISKEDYMKDLQKLFDKGLLTDEKIAQMEDNYLPIYPIAAAIYEKETAWYITGSSYDSTRRKARRDCNYYKSML